MGGVIDKIPDLTIDKINILRKNALAQLDNPKQQQTATEILDAIDKELERRYLPGMIATFKEHYPGGFYGEAQAEQERDYKTHACAQFIELLRKEEFQKLLQNDQYDELYRRVTELIQLTNFIQGSFEKPVLLEAIKNNKQKYLEALYKCVWGEEALRVRFDEFMSVLKELQLCKWTYATYFLFLSNPEEYMFVKPEMLKKSLDISKYPLDYESQPSSELYLEILEFSKWLKEKIRVLEPRDMIDVHSFMWHMAPTGKFSES